jgi:hypothetical protein
MTLFALMVRESAQKHGNVAPAIADDLIDQAFADIESLAAEKKADRFFRAGLVDAVRAVLGSADGDDGTMMRRRRELDARFRGFSRCLRRIAYYVPSLSAYVELPHLVANPALFDEACRYMRLKGMEVLCEADRLNHLRKAVIAAAPKSEAA